MDGLVRVPAAMHSGGMAELHIEVHDGDPGRVALILPGTGYTAKMPLLASAGDALRDLGWSLRIGVWDGKPRLDEGRDAGSRAVNDLLDAAPDARHLVVAKSLGTLAFPAAVLREIPGAWLTPLISEQGEEDVRAAASQLATTDLPTLLVGGSEDPYWDPVLAARSGARVVEILHGGHGLTVPGDWRASHAALLEVTAAIQALAVRVAG